MNTVLIFWAPKYPQKMQLFHLNVSYDEMEKIKKCHNFFSSLGEATDEFRWLATWIHTKTPVDWSMPYFARDTNWDGILVVETGFLI